MSKTKSLLRLLSFLVVIMLALALRLRAVDKLPIDYDEDDYLAAAQRYRAALRRGDWQLIINYDFNYEHPPLTKLVYGMAILPLPDAPLLAERPSTDPPTRSLPQPQFDVARLTSTALGWLEVVALAFFNPLAALFLGVHTWQIKYTTQVMLEALPSLTSILTILCYIRGRSGALRGRLDVWLLLSAVWLGLTAASKYTYCLAGIAILVDWLWTTFPAEASRRAAAWLRWLAPVAGWGIVSMAVFVAFDPRLWADGFQRLKETVFFHGAYAQSRHVQEAGFPMWQPLVWLASSVPWHPGVFLVMLDGGITLLAVAGLRRTWQKHRVLVLWLGLALGFLLVWNTKWPQYILTLTAPLAVVAAEGAMAAVEPLLAWLRRMRAEPRAWAWRPANLLAPLRSRDLWRAAPWLWPGAIGLLLLAIFPLLFQVAMALTDFNGASIRDGINGGVWREVWLGLTGQVKPIEFDPFSSTGYSARTVHYAGPGLLLAIFNGAADILVFDVVWVVLSVALQAALGIGVALMLNRRGVRGARVWRTVFVLPWAIPEFIGALIWLRTFEPKIGWLGMLVSKDVPLPPTLGSNALYALGVLLVAATWYGFPFVMLAASAGLKLVPREAYDAAALDGAAGLATFRYITWPLLFPLVAPALIIRSIFAFNQFYLFYVMQTESPLLTFANISYYFFTYGNAYAVSAVVNVFTVIVLIGLLVWFNRWSRAAEGVTYA